VFSPRAEGLAVSSPALQGGVFKRPLTRGPTDRHSGCVAPSALLLTNARRIPALHGRAYSLSALRGLTAQIRHGNCEQQPLAAKPAQIDRS
jgi:hypothetical protein